MSSDHDLVLEEFLRDHPEHAGRERVLPTPDGTEELCIRLETAEAFLRWCLFHGHGDAPKIVAFLADELPRLRAPERDPGADGPGATDG